MDGGDNKQLPQKTQKGTENILLNPMKNSSLCAFRVTNGKKIRVLRK